MQIWIGFSHSGNYFELYHFELHHEPSDHAKRLLEMTMLIPNIKHPRSNNVDMIFCLPVTWDKWSKWKALSDRHNKECQGVSYMDRVEKGEVRTIIMLPSYEQTDEDVLTAVAYMRMIDNLTCRMYVVRAAYEEPSQAQVMNAVIGADPTTIINVPEDFGDEQDSSND